MEPRISLITLGVADLERATRFYGECLGLPRLQTPPSVTDGFLWEVAHNPDFPHV
jgi:catechol 2,3-dioxygenase-like lactoylglutathione lyase family enzyme